MWELSSLRYASHLRLPSPDIWMGTGILFSPWWCVSEESVFTALIVLLSAQSKILNGGNYGTKLIKLIVYDKVFW